MGRLRIDQLLCMIAFVIGMSFQQHAVAGEKEITVGGKNFTEQYIFAEMMGQILTDRGFDLHLMTDLTSMALRAGMESGDIDVCAEYTGTAWMVHLKKEYKPGVTRNELYELVREEDLRNDFVWFSPIWNHNTYALASWSDFARNHNLKTLSDLARLYQQKGGKIRTFIDFEFSTRPDGLPAMERIYDFRVAHSALKTDTPGASVIALRERMVDVAMVFGTDASIAKHDWYVYTDDRSFFPPYDLAPYVREEVLDRYPEISDILQQLIASFPGGGYPAKPDVVSSCQKIWRELNAEVDVERSEPSEVAREYLIQHGLVAK